MHAALVPKPTAITARASRPREGVRIATSAAPGVTSAAGATAGPRLIPVRAAAVNAAAGAAMAASASGR